ncbi:MAG: hypothetical protein Q8S18_02470 [Bacteroidales bacterium]|nr:hypothetical protein [Bacteroidales bacterium]
MRGLTALSSLRSVAYPRQPWESLHTCDPDGVDGIYYIVFYTHLTPLGSILTMYRKSQTNNPTPEESHVCRKRQKNNLRPQRGRMFLGSACSKSVYDSPRRWRGFVIRAYRKVTFTHKIEVASGNTSYIIS